MKNFTLNFSSSRALRIFSAILLLTTLCICNVWGADTTDAITASDLAATGTTYTDFSNVSKSSDAVYAGISALNNSTNMQFRSKNSNSGLVSTTSGGHLKSVKITVASGSNSIDIYGSNTAYTAASDLYSTSTQGTKIGTLTATGTITATGDYAYVGIRSNNGAIYLSSIEITWSDGAAPSYTITATSNNNSYGTVSLEGSTITASPKSGYRVSTSSAYTVTSGTATVTNNGDNTFTVSASSNCTVRINFEAIPKYKVTFSAGTGSCGTASLTEATGGAGVTLPSATPPATCTSWTFAGWATASVSETDEAPTLVGSAGDNYKPTGNCTLYAVYKVVEGGSNTYEKVTDSDDITDGQYLIVYETGSVAFNGGLTTLDATSNTISVSISSSSIAISDATEDAEFTINTTNNSIKSASGFYIGRTANSNGMNTHATTVYANTMSIDNDGNFVAQGSSSTATYLRYNKSSGQTRFRYFTSGQEAIQLYKKQAGSTTWNSSPSCSSLPKCATPTFSPGAGTYTSAQSVSISCSTAGATIHYTTDGSTPTESSPTYTSAISVSENMTIKARAFKSGTNNPSDVASAAYVINLPQCATPSFSPAAGVYSSTQSVTISCGTAGATIYYTTDGSTPTSSSTTYSSAISVSSTTTIKAIAYKSGTNTPSEVASATYTISAAATIFELVTVASTLVEGDEVIILDENNEYALSTTQNTNNRSGVAASGNFTVSGSNVTVTSADVQVITLGEGTQGWTMHVTGDATGYLYAPSSSSNQLKTRAENTNADSKWAISITSGIASIVAQGSNTRNTLQFNPNNGSPLFTCYASASQTALRLYRKVDNTPHTITFNYGGGTGSPASWTQPTGGAATTLPTATLSDATCISKGWTFAGWKRSTACNGCNNPTLFTGTYIPRSDETLYAVYTKVGKTNSTAAFNPTTMEGLEESTEYERDWIHTASGIEIYLSAGQRYTSGTPNTFTVTKGTDNYLLITAPAGKTITCITLSMSETGYGIGTVSTGTLTTDGTTQTVNLTPAQYTDEISLFATADNQIRAASLTVTYKTVRFETSPDCDASDCQWQIDYDTDGSSGSAAWSSENCFTQVGTSHLWQIDDFVVPDVTGQFWVGPGKFLGEPSGHSYSTALSNIYTAKRSDNTRTNSNYSVQTGSVGTLIIYDNSDLTNGNYYCSLQPVYQLTYGIDGASIWRNIPFEYVSGTEYRTAQMTAPANYFNNSDFKFYVGIRKSDGNTIFYDKATGKGQSKTVAMNTMRGMSASDQAGIKGYWRIYEDSGDDNWYCEWVPITHHTVTLVDNGTSYTEIAYVDEEYHLPETGNSDCADATFLGWVRGTYTDHLTGTTTQPTGILEPGTAVDDITAATTFTAVYRGSDPGSIAEWRKMTSSDVLTTGNKIVIVPNDPDAQYALYQETVSSSYVNFWNFSKANIESDEKNYLSVSEATTNTWYLGDATNGYINNSTNKLYVNSTKSAWTITWNGTEEAFTIKSGDYYLSCRSDLSADNQYKYRTVSSTNNGSVYFDIYRFSGSRVYTSKPYCCHAPATPLSIDADATSLAGSGTVALTLSGGNGKAITWTTTGGTLSNQTNSGATLTLPTAAATTIYTVTATQAVNEDDADNILCGAVVSINIEVKAQFTITFKTKDDGIASTFSTITVTDGDDYTLPDISEDYTCEDGYSFAGWAESESAITVVKAPNGSATAEGAGKTWWAVWGYSTGTTKAYIYEEVNSLSALTAGDKVIIGSYSYWLAMGATQNSNNRAQATIHQNGSSDTQTYFLESDNVQVFTLGGNSTNGWTFYDDVKAGYIAAASSSSNYLRTISTLTDNGKWNISIDSETAQATVEAKGTYTHKLLQYNNSSKIFSCYANSQANGGIIIYKRTNTQIDVAASASTTYTVNNTHCSSGAAIRIADSQWITSANGQKVRTTLSLTAKGFDAATTLTATSNNEKFTIALANNNIPATPATLATTLTVEYTPTSSDVREAATITLTAGDVTKQITVNGRSLPDEFVIATNKGSTWYALPANMTDGAGTYDGIVVAPNAGLTLLPIASSRILYSLSAVASSRYAEAGQCVRLVGNNNKCLWTSSSAGNTDLQNYAMLAATNGSNYEWLLSTTDGEQYTITVPSRSAASDANRQLAYNVKFGYYKSESTFYLLPVGCSTYPVNVQVSPRRVEATFSWQSSASEMLIEAFTDEEMTAGRIATTVTSSPATLTGLTEQTTYYYRLTPDGSASCAVTGDFTTTGPLIDIVEWEENAVIIHVDKDDNVHPQIVIQGEVEHGTGSSMATDIFFSKYFEAEGDAKLLGIYNGTGNKIALDDITILQRCTKHAQKYEPFSIAGFGATEAGYIYPGEEIIIFNRDSRDAVMTCAENDPTYDKWNNVENNNLAFSGKGTIRLFRGSTCIDIIGAMEVGGDIDDITAAPMEGLTSPSFGDATGFVTNFGDNYATDEQEIDYELSTNRCLLIRKPFVTSGDSAVLNNFGDFVTLGLYHDQNSVEHLGEWAGLQIPTAKDGNGNKTFQYTCEGFQEVGSFDYNKYYKEFNTIGEGTLLESYYHENGDYTIPIDYMRQYACLNLKFQLVDNSDPSIILTEQESQVPIIVTQTNTLTTDTLFRYIMRRDQAPFAPMEEESINRCKNCNVVILRNASLKKDPAPGATLDAETVGNIKVYPGGTLIVPNGTELNANSLSLRRQNDDISTVSLLGTGNLNLSESNGVYLDLRIDPSDWHFVTLPYNCNVDQVRFSNGNEARLGADWLCRWYDGEYRAAHKDGGWTDVEPGTILEKGMGFIVGIPGSGLVKSELRFPMAKEVIDEDQEDKTIGQLYAYGCDNDELRWNHKGWNLIGNPYLTYYDAAHLATDAPLVMGTLEKDYEGSDIWLGHWKLSTDGGKNVRYLIAPIDPNGWEGYHQVAITNPSALGSASGIKPFTSYFVQVGGTVNDPQVPQGINFTSDHAVRSSIVARRAPTEDDAENTKPVWFGITLSNSNGESDETGLLISDRFTDQYDMMDDLLKMRGSYYKYYNHPIIASRNDEGEMAFNALPDASAAAGVPINYYASQNGEYTIATDDRYDLSNIEEAWLYDSDSQQYINLLLEDYRFTSTKQDNSSRFTLQVKVRRAPQIVTSIGQTSALTAVRVFEGDGTLTLRGLPQGAKLWVYSMDGKLVYANPNTTEQHYNLTLSTGVYNIKVVYSNEATTLKGIVK